MSSGLTSSVVDALEKGNLSAVLGIVPGGSLLGGILENMTARTLKAANAESTGVVVLVPWVGFPSVRAQ